MGRYITNMNLNNSDIEKLTQNLPPEEEQGPMPDTSNVLEDVKEMRNRIILYKQKKIDTHLPEDKFTQKLERIIQIYIIIFQLFLKK